MHKKDSVFIRNTNKYIISQQTNILYHNKQIYYLTTNKYIISQQTNILSHNKQIYYLTINKYIISQQTNRKQKTTFFFFTFLLRTVCSWFLTGVLTKCADRSHNCMYVLQLDNNCIVRKNSTRVSAAMKTNGW